MRAKKGVAAHFHYLNIVLSIYLCTLNLIENNNGTTFERTRNNT